MTDIYRIRHYIIKHGLSLDWLVEQFRHRRYGVTLVEIQDVYAGIKTGPAAEPIIKKAMTIIDEYDAWLAGVSA